MPDFTPPDVRPAVEESGETVTQRSLRSVLLREATRTPPGTPVDVRPLLTRDSFRWEQERRGADPDHPDRPWLEEALAYGPERVVGASSPLRVEALPAYLLRPHAPAVDAAGEPVGKAVLNELAALLRRVFRPARSWLATDGRDRPLAQVWVRRFNPGVILPAEQEGYAMRQASVELTVWTVQDAAGLLLPYRRP